MSVVRQNDPDNKPPSKPKIYIYMIAIGVLAGSLYSFAKSPQFQTMQDKFTQFKSAVLDTKDRMTAIQEKVQEAQERFEEAESYEPYEREERDEDKGFAYDDFETDFDY